MDSQEINIAESQSISWNTSKRRRIPKTRWGMHTRFTGGGGAQPSFSSNNVDRSNWRHPINRLLSPQNDPKIVPEPTDTRANSLLEHAFWLIFVQKSVTDWLTDGQTLLDRVKFWSNERKERCAQILLISWNANDAPLPPGPGRW